MQKSKGVLRMLPNVLQPSATDHVPVLAEEVRELLAVQPGETVVDATFGAGGHAALLAADLQGRGKLIAIDRDPTVRPYFERFKRGAGGLQTRLLRGEFSLVLEQLAGERRRGGRDPARPRRLEHAARPARARLLVRGRRAARHAHGSATAELTAADLVNESPERELANDLPPLRRGALRAPDRAGDRPPAQAAVRADGRARRRDQVGDPAPARFGEGHPAKRVFQALRIAVNDELGALERALPAAFDMLRPGGRLAVISFHSLEDRIVKTFMRDEERGCTCPPDFPICVCGNEPAMRAVSRKPIRPTADEVAQNPRAASARLRAAVKVFDGDLFAARAEASAPPRGVQPRAAAARARPARLAARTASSWIVLVGSCWPVWSLSTLRCFKLNVSPRQAQP